MHFPAHDHAIAPVGPKYHAVLSGSNTSSLSAQWTPPPGFPGRCLLKLQSLYIRDTNTRSIEVRFTASGCRAPFTWDSRNPNGMGTQTIAVYQSNQAPGDPIEIVYDLPQGPAYLQIDVYDLTTNAALLVSGSAPVYALAVLELTPVQ